MGIAEALALVRDGGMIALLLAVLIGGHKGVWVWGWVAERERTEKEDWRRIALTLIEVGDKSTALSATLAEKLEHQR